jgi:DNA-binding transcriptional LysR family regulator
MKFIILINIIKFTDMKLTFRQLEVLVAIAKYENMSLAAENIHLTQSACSMSLSNLEHQLGGTLFNRVGKQLILNERGRMLYPKAVNILIQVNELQSLMMDTQKNPIGHLIIGASSTIGNYILPKIISQFIRKFPQAKISLQVSNTEQIINKMLNFEIDIGFIEGNCYSLDLNVQTWREDRLIIIASPDHSLSNKKKISLHDLKRAEWILREKGSGTREQFEIAMKANILPYMEFSHTEAIKHAVMTGIGIGCVSELTVTELLKNKKLVYIPTPFLKLSRHLYILLHKEKYQTAILREFMKQCHS